jgi:methionine-rich copper-binding protein CopC
MKAMSTLAALIVAAAPLTAMAHVRLERSMPVSGSTVAASPPTSP